VKRSCRPHRAKRHSRTNGYIRRDSVDRVRASLVHVSKLHHRRKTAIMPPLLATKLIGAFALQMVNSVESVASHMRA
jgi:hypothetical protein